LSSVNQRETYDPGLVYDTFFNFTETEAFSINFERMGLESTNFVDLTGPVLIDLSLMVGIKLFFQLI
jgi:hypothetical protein